MSCRRSPPLLPCCEIAKTLLAAPQLLEPGNCRTRCRAGRPGSWRSNRRCGVSACSLRPSTPCAPSPACSVMSQSWQQRPNSKGNQIGAVRIKLLHLGHRARGRFSSRHSTEMKSRIYRRVLPQFADCRRCRESYVPQQPLTVSGRQFCQARQSIPTEFVCSTR